MEFNISLRPKHTPFLSSLQPSHVLYFFCLLSVVLSVPIPVTLVFAIHHQRCVRLINVRSREIPVSDTPAIVLLSDFLQFYCLAFDLHFLSPLPSIRTPSFLRPSRRAVALAHGAFGGRPAFIWATLGNNLDSVASRAGILSQYQTRRLTTCPVGHSVPLEDPHDIDPQAIAADTAPASCSIDPMLHASPSAASPFAASLPPRLRLVRLSASARPSC